VKATKRGPLAKLSQQAAARIGRAALVLLPVLGGLFAVYLLQSDLQRLQEEKLKDRGGVTEHRKIWCLSTILFGGAAIADLIDAISHFVIAYAVFRGFGHHAVLHWEEISLACAVASTACAIVGEVLSHTKLQKQREVVAEMG